MTYPIAKQMIKKLNRRIGQLNRHWLWNVDRIEEATRERDELNRALPQLKARQEEAQNFWLTGEFN